MFIVNSVYLSRPSFDRFGTIKQNYPLAFFALFNASFHMETGGSGISPAVNKNCLYWSLRSNRYRVINQVIIYSSLCDKKSPRFYRRRKSLIVERQSQQSNKVDFAVETNSASGRSTQVLQILQKKNGKVKTVTVEPWCLYRYL